MGKIKSSDTLSLDKSKQKKVVKQTKQLKKKVQTGKISVKRLGKPVGADAIKNRGLIYIGHIPHGFYEEEMKKYFKQFGSVTNVKVCRSNKTGNSKGYGYVEFSHQEVAKIAAETMNNYLMFKKRVVAEYVPVEKRPKGLFRGRSSNKSLYSTKVRREKQRIANLKVDKNTHMKRTSARLSKINNKLEILKKVGIDYDFKPTDVPEKIGKKSRKGNQSSKAKGVERKIKVKSEKVMYTFQQDPNDSEIEIKVPLILKPRTKRTTRKVPSTVVTKKTAKKAPQTKKTLQQKLVKRKNVKK